MEQSKSASAAACAVLKKHGLIIPWPITVKADNGERQIGGLFQVDNVLLNQLSAEALFEVRNAGGLLVAYCQLLSMQHLPLLGQLAEAHAKADKEAAEAVAIARQTSLELVTMTKTAFSGLIRQTWQRQLQTDKPASM